MRVRGVLGFAFGLAAAALSSCGGPKPLIGGGSGKGHTYPKNPRDQDIYMFLDAACQVQKKTEPNVAFSDKDVTWHIIGDCNQGTANLQISFSDDILAKCDQTNNVQKCSVSTSGTGGTITAHIKPNTASDKWYQYTIQFGTVSIDPYLEIDP